MIVKHRIKIEPEEAFITIIDKFLISITMKPNGLNRNFYSKKYETESLSLDTNIEIDFLSSDKYSFFNLIVYFEKRFYLCNDQEILIVNYTNNFLCERVIKLIDRIY